MGVWIYTAKERKAIGEAYDVCRYMAEARGKERVLDGAVRQERRGRSCITAAKWLVAESFAKGLCANPRASELAWMSEGCQVAALVGAACRVSDLARDQVMARLHGRMDALFAAARAAQNAHMDRGLDRAAASSPPISEAVVEIVNNAKPRRGAAYREAIGASIRQHRAVKGGAK
jgi:hypothetical protein